MLGTIPPVGPILRELILTVGVSGAEHNVAGRVEELLRQHGVRQTVHNDSLGNRWLYLGPDGDPQRILLAHMDEIGLRITSVREDGICRVTAIGGIDAQLWEGTAVQVHAKDGPVPGCIAPVSLHVTDRQGLGPRERLKVSDLLLDVGAGSAAEVEQLGIRLLDPVTWPKSFTPLTGQLVQARSLDDRFGCAALVAAAASLAQAEPSIPTVFAWTVQEELGLRGASALARRFPTCQEAIAVDSFTAGAGPRDNKQFAGCTLGGGPVLRCFDSRILLPDSEREEVLGKANQLGCKLQYGYMPGGNDAAWYVEYSARVFGLGISVQYSHSNVERAHLGDLEQLSALLADWCRTGV